MLLFCFIVVMKVNFFTTFYVNPTNSNLCVYQIQCTVSHVQNLLTDIKSKRLAVGLLCIAPAHRETFKISGAPKNAS